MNKNSSGDVSTYITRRWGILIMVVGAETMVWAIDQSLCPRLRSRTRPNPHEVLFHLRDLGFRQFRSLSKLIQIDDGIALHRCKCLVPILMVTSLPTST